MSRAQRYPERLHERAARLVREHLGRYESAWAAIILIATKRKAAAGVASIGVGGQGFEPRTPSMRTQCSNR